MFRGAIAPRIHSANAAPLVRRSGLGAPARDLAEPPQTLARQRLEHRIADAEESAPRRRLVRREPLPHLGERHGREIEHRLRGEQIEVRHRLVGAGDDAVDLIRLGGERARRSDRASRASGTRAPRRRRLEHSASRSTARRLHAIPVEKSGSTNAYACGSIAHRSPAARVEPMLNARQNAIGMIGVASANALAIVG